MIIKIQVLRDTDNIDTREQEVTWNETRSDYQNQMGGSKAQPKNMTIT